MKIQCSINNEIVQAEIGRVIEVLDTSVSSIQGLRYQIESCPLICEAILWVKQHNGSIKYAACQELLDPGDKRVIFMLSIIAKVNRCYFDQYAEDFEDVPKTIDKASEYSYIRGNSQVGIMISFDGVQPC
jgi:hypothetical protein